MTTTPRQLRLLAVAVAVVALLGLFAARGDWLTHAAPASQPGALRVVPTSGVASAASRAGHAPFAGVVSVSQLRPGQLQTLRVKVTNPDQVAYQVLELTATPQDANPSCSGASNLVVSSYHSTRPGSPTYVVPRKSSITIPLTVMMLDTAASQDGCENGSFPLTFGGLATQGQAEGRS